jgi:hypothetical protein
VTDLLAQPRDIDLDRVALDFGIERIKPLLDVALGDKA